MPEHETYSTPSTSDPRTRYTLYFAHNHYICSCPGYSFRGKCKHAEAINRLAFIDEKGNETSLKELGLGA